jgi:hypothetical protein
MQMFGVTGESLGTIGAQAEVKEQPQWQRLLTAKPSVSVRKGIAWVSVHLWVQWMCASIIPPPSCLSYLLAVNSNCFENTTTVRGHTPAPRSLLIACSCFEGAALFWYWPAQWNMALSSAVLQSSTVLSGVFSSFSSTTLLSVTETSSFIIPSTPHEISSFRPSFTP